MARAFPWPWQPTDGRLDRRIASGVGARTRVVVTRMGFVCPSATGHLLGAAGGLESIFSILALRDGILPPTLNLKVPDPAADGLDLIGPEARRDDDIEREKSNGFGFGGVNASIVLRRSRPGS